MDHTVVVLTAPGRRLPLGDGVSMMICSAATNGMIIPVDSLPPVPRLDMSPGVTHQRTIERQDPALSAKDP
jgi:hypothetical protein